MSLEYLYLVYKFLYFYPRLTVLPIKAQHNHVTEKGEAISTKTFLYAEHSKKGQHRTTLDHLFLRSYCDANLFVFCYPYQAQPHGNWHELGSFSEYHFANWDH